MSKGHKKFLTTMMPKHIDKYCIILVELKITGLQMLKFFIHPMKILLNQSKNTKKPRSHDKAFICMKELMNWIQNINYADSTSCKT